VASQESNFNSQAVSPAGAQGLMQFMPATAKGLGVNALDPASAINGAAKYLSSLTQQFGSTELALAAYNAGPGTVSRYGGIPPYSETQNYVRAVMTKAEAYR
jgi:peptidoglycan DL-endopeptidase CwlO